MGNIHETIDRIGTWTPRAKWIAGGLLFALVVGLLAFVFWLGVKAGDGWASSRYIRERDQRMKEIAGHEENARQLAAENALLRKQNEAVAEILASEDKRRAADAARAFAELQAEKNEGCTRSTWMIRLIRNCAGCASMQGGQATRFRRGFAVGADPRNKGKS
jgi:hypothetical protein